MSRPIHDGACAALVAEGAASAALDHRPLPLVHVALDVVHEMVLRKSVIGLYKVHAPHHGLHVVVRLQQVHRYNVPVTNTRHIRPQAV